MAINNNCPFDLAPYTQSQVITTPSIFNLNYTNQDFWSMKTRLVEFIQQKFSTDFSDFVESSLAMMLIENWSFLADTLSFKMDQIANEIFIDTVTETENAFRLAKLVGFNPQPPVGARAMFTATLNNPLSYDVVIPSPFQLKLPAGGSVAYIELYQADSENNPIFDEDILIPAGNIVNASVIGLEGRTRTLSAGGTGAVGQTLQLGTLPVIFDSIRVYVDGVLWDQVDYFTDSQPRREYRIEYDSNYVAYVIFGNNRTGLIPSIGSSIEVIYRTGGGPIGNIVSGSVNSQTVITVPGLQYPVPVAFRNYTKGEFGFSGDTIDDIRLKLPAWLRAQNRAVTGLDYKILTDQFATPYQGQIGKSTAVLRNYGCAGNIVDLYVLARDADNNLQLASDDLKNSLQVYINDKKMLTDFVCIRDGQVLMVDLAIDIVLDRLYRKFEDEIRTKIQRRLGTYFAIQNWEFNENLKDTEIAKVLSDIKEISRLDITFTTNDPNNGGNLVTTQFFEIIRPDVTTIGFTYE